MTESITTFFGEHRYLSNFFPALVKLDGVWFPSVEHAYQAAKTHDTAFRHAIQQIKPGEAKRLGRLVQLRPEWLHVRNRVMEDFVRQKFRWPELRRLLLNTYSVHLMEGNTWHDNYWGVCLCGKCESADGQNHLGKILMKVREEMIV